MGKDVKRPTVSPLEAHLGYLLRFVSNHVSHAFSLKLATRDITVAEWVVMRELYEQDAVAPSQIAARLGMTRGAISKIADRLIAKSLVVRAHNRADRRYQALALTQSGYALVPRLSALADQNDEAFFGHLKATERRTIETILKGLVQHHGLRTIPVE